LLSVEGLPVQGCALDAIDGPPVPDRKAYMIEFVPRGDVRQAELSHQLMAGYWDSSTDP
jgi:tRNA (Thr-GGU) A37 N-methylase